MKSNRQDSLWSWGYKNINSRLFCLCFKRAKLPGLCVCVCVRMSRENCLVPIKTKTGDTSVSLDHGLVKVCLRGEGGHMCLRKLKRGLWVETGLVPCRNPTNPALPIKPFLIYSYHILHNLFVLCPIFSLAFSLQCYKLYICWELGKQPMCTSFQQPDVGRAHCPDCYKVYFTVSP